MLLAAGIVAGFTAAMATGTAAHGTTPLAHRFIEVADDVYAAVGNGTGKEAIDYLQAFLRDLWRQAKALHEQNVPVAEAARRIDMTAYRPHFDNFAKPGIPEATAARLYQVLEQR
jgi:hypothetical protein